MNEKTHQKLRNKLRSLIALLLLPTVGTAQTMQWKEEVKLHDGKVIIADRFYNLGGYPGYESRERVALDETVTFHLSDGKDVVWKSDFRDSSPEPNSLNHFRFDVVDGVPYLATYPAGCIAYNKWGRPNPPQVLLRFERGSWLRIGVKELPSVIVGAKANVVVGRPASSLLRGLYSIDDVIEKDRYIMSNQYDTVLVQPQSHAESQCPNLVYYKGAWVEPGDSIGKKLMDQRFKNK